MEPVKVAVLGISSKDAVFYCSPALFLHSAAQLGGEPVWSPPPFATPCKDGLLIVYTLRRSGPSCTDVHGCYILVPKEEIRTGGGKVAYLFWKMAKKPVSMQQMLQQLGFKQRHEYLLN